MFRCSLILGFAACFAAGTSNAEEHAAAQAYGIAVSAFHLGNVQEAYDHLDALVKKKSDDPRVHFYRGLANWKLGRTKEAEADFKAAAALEAGDTVGFYNVSRALERVQGKERLAIEGYRRAAKKAATEKLEAEREARRKQLHINEPQVIEKAQPGARNADDPLAEPVNPKPKKQANPQPEKPGT